MKNYDEYIKQKEHLLNIEKKMFDELCKRIELLRKYKKTYGVFTILQLEDEITLGNNKFVIWVDYSSMIWIHINVSNKTLLTIRNDEIKRKDELMKDEFVKLKKESFLEPLYLYFMDKDLISKIEAKNLGLL